MEIRPILLILLLGITSCVETETSKKLSLLEEMISVSPDSVKKELCSFTSDSDRMSLSDRVRYTVLVMESTYRLSQRVDTVSLSFAESYYALHSGRRSGRSYIIYSLLHSILLYQQEDYLGSLVELHSISECVEELSDSYLSGVVHYYFGRIYFRNRLYRYAIESFRRERAAVCHLGDINKIVKSDHHCALTFLSLGSLDSCQYYLRHSLCNLSRLDTIRRKIVCYNITLLERTFFSNQEYPFGYFSCDNFSSRSRKDTLNGERSSLSGPSCSLNAFIPFSGRLGTIPALPVIAPYYMTLYHYYRCQEDALSALRYYEYYHLAKSLFIEGLRTWEISVLENRLAEERRERAHRRFFMLCSVIFTLFLFVVLFYLRYRIDDQTRQLEEALVACRRHLFLRESELLSVCRQCQKLEYTLEEVRDQLTESIQEHSQDRRLLSSYRDLVTRMFHRFMFKDLGAPIYGRDFFLLVEEYASSSSSGLHFVKHLRSLEIRLSDRDLFICILLHESGHGRGDLSEVIGSSSRNAFKSAKSKIKSRLLSLKHRDREVEELLVKF